MHRRSDGARFIGNDLIYLAPADWRDISVALKKEFPALRFAHSPSFANIDRDEAVQVLRRIRPKWQEGARIDPDDAIESWVAKPQPKWRVRYTDLIEADPAHGWTSAWIEPPGWAPVWRVGLAAANPNLSNEPAPSISVLHSAYAPCREVSDRFKPIWAGNGNDKVVMLDGRWYGWYRPGEDEHRRFLARVRRIILKHSTNALAWVHYATHTVVDRFPKGGIQRVGFHALEWARAHPGHQIGGSSDRNYFKPIDWALSDTNSAGSP